VYLNTATVVSSGQYRGKRAGKIATRTRVSSRKPRREGLTTIPKQAWPVVHSVLQESGLDGLAVWCCVFYLGGTDLVKARLEDEKLIVFTGSRDRSFSLRPAEAVVIAELLGQFATRTRTMSEFRAKGYVALVLSQKVQPEVRRRLKLLGMAWADQVNVSLTTLKRTGAMVVAENYSEHWEYLRAYFRSPNAHPDDRLNSVTDELAAVYSEAVRGFWSLVEQELSHQARSAIVRLAR
jgi:hypothetical protein